MKPMGVRVLTTEEIRQFLRRRYLWPRYLFLEEVNEGTGAHGQRFADGLALALWPSDNLWLYGFEIKVSRGDLLTELKQPQKWRGVGRYCDYWWLVVPEGIYKKTDDIPAAWGVMSLCEDFHPRIRKRPRRQETEPMNRPFIAALLRNGVRIKP